MASHYKYKPFLFHPPPVVEHQWRSRQAQIILAIPRYDPFPKDHVANCSSRVVSSSCCAVSCSGRLVTCPCRALSFADSVVHFVAWLHNVVTHASSARVPCRAFEDHPLNPSVAFLQGCVERAVAVAGGLRTQAACAQRAQRAAHLVITECREGCAC